MDGPFAHSFIEVYPHVAIIELFQYQYRFPYKVEKRSRYWPAFSPKKRLRAIVRNLHELRGKLSNEIGNVDEFLPELDPSIDYKIKFLKSYEDLLDAVVCALVGQRFSEGRAVPFGDDAGVIWVPRRKESDEKAV
jgi:predicted RNase H-like nuclease